MEIKKLLKIKTLGTTPIEPNGALIADVNIEYPVLLDSLINTVIFPQLRESGYKLIALPYTFEKDGVSTKSLPVEEYAPTKEEEENLYAMIGEKYNNGDFSQVIEKATVQLTSMPKTEITIHTREEFLKYLEYIQRNTESFPMPFGYFVSQAALFTYEEYMSEDLSYYRSIIEARHRVSYDSYLKLCAFFKDFGLSEDATYFDIINLYLSWGLDGLKYTIIDSEVCERKFTVYDVYVKSDGLPTTTKPGFIDNKQKKYFDERQPGNWTISKYSQKTAMSFVVPDANGKIALPDNELLMVDFAKPRMVKSNYTHCSGYEYIFDDEYILINNTQLEHVITVESDFPGELVPTECLGLAKETVQKYYDWQYLYAVANDILELRKKKCDMSSYKLLQMFNYTPVEALKYVALKAGYTAASVNTEQGDEEPVILPDGIYSEYVSAEWDTIKEKYGDEASSYEDILNDIVCGNINCDYIAQGKKDDSSSTASYMYKVLWAVHNVLGIPMDVIVEKTLNTPMSKDTYKIDFTKDGVTYKFDRSPIDGHYRGYKADSVNYLRAASRDAYTILEVQKIFREIGTNDATRHVGASVICINRTSGIIRVINQLKAKYAELIETNVVSSVSRKVLHQNADVFATQALFEIYHTGKCGFLGLPNAPKFEAPAEMREVIDASTKLYVDSIQAFTVYAQTIASTVAVKSLARDEEVASEYGFGTVCVNAFMCQDQIIPRKGYTIPEVALFAVWNDYRNKPNIQSQLVSLGIIPERHMPFTFSYDKLKFLQYKKGVADDPMSLEYYITNARKEMKEYKEDKSTLYSSVTHPIEYLYDNIYKKQEAAFVMDLETYPRFPIGLKRDLTKDTFADMMEPSEVEDKHGVYPFKGFHTEVFKYKLNPLTLLPYAKNGKSLLYDHETFFTLDTRQPFDFTRVKELESMGYPVKHIYNNLYLVRINSDVLLEVYV